MSPNSKTFLVVSPIFWVVKALEGLTTRKFNIQDLEEVKKVNLQRLAASRRPLDNPKLRPDLQKGRGVYAYNITGDFVAFLVRDLCLLIINPSVAQLVKRVGPTPQRRVRFPASAMSFN